MFWIIGAGFVGCLLFLVVLTLIICACKKYKSHSGDQENLKPPWYSQNITYGNLGQVKCIRSNLNRTESSSSNEWEQCIAPDGIAGSLVNTVIQPDTARTPVEKATSTHITKWRHSSVSSSPVEGSSRASDDEDGEDFSSTKGKLWFSAKYNNEEQLLCVEVIKAKYLKGRSMLYSPRDPFVRVYLLPDESNYYQTKVRHRTLSPKFKEKFTFKLEYENASSQSLKFVVYDFDKKNVRHSLGHAIVPLAKINLTTGDVICQELDDYPQKTCYIGELLLSLSWNPYSDKIKVTVLTLKNLPLKLNGKLPDVYVTVDLYHGRRLMKSKKSLMHPGGAIVEIREAFTFVGAGRYLDSCSIALTVKARMRSELVTSDKAIGRLAVGPFQFARGQELLHWQEILSNPKTTVEKWHSLCEP